MSLWVARVQKTLACARGGKGHKPGSVPVPRSQSSISNTHRYVPLAVSSSLKQSGEPWLIRPCFRWGLPSQTFLKACWCALTAPFHPYLCDQAVCFLLHFPSASRLPLAGWFVRCPAVSWHPALRSPDFPHTLSVRDRVPFPKLRVSRHISRLKT
jgi:hypothetical protein